MPGREASPLSFAVNIQNDEGKLRWISIEPEHSGTITADGVDVEAQEGVTVPTSTRVIEQP